MKIVVQRCLNAKVEVDNKVVGKIDSGLDSAYRCRGLLPATVCFFTKNEDGE